MLLRICLKKVSTFFFMQKKTVFDCDRQRKIMICYVEAGSKTTRCILSYLHPIQSRSTSVVYFLAFNCLQPQTSCTFKIGRVI